MGAKEVGVTCSTPLPSAALNVVASMSAKLAVPLALPAALVESIGSGGASFDATVAGRSQGNCVCCVAVAGLVPVLSPWLVE